MTTELEPLDADVLVLLREAKPIADLAPTSKAAILAAVEARVGVPPTPGGGGDTGAAGGGAAGGGGGAGAGGAAAGAAASRIGARALAALAATFALGVATGVVFAPSRTGPSTTRTEVVPAVRPAAPVSENVPSELPAVSVASLPSASVPGAASVPSRSGRVERPEAPAPSARGLGAERSLLDVARAALARGDATEAMAAVDRHTHTYPDGVLVEEREAIAVKALVALGHRDDALVRAQRFERRFPNGLMLRAVKGAVGDL